MARDIATILRDDAKRRNARMRDEDAIAQAILAKANRTSEFVNESAPGWRTPEVHAGTHLMPAKAKSNYVDTVRTNRMRNATRRRPNLAGSISYNDALISTNPQNPPIHVNAVKVTYADGRTEIVALPQSPTFRIARTEKRRTTTSTTTTITNAAILRHNEVARLSTDLALADGTA